MLTEPFDPADAQDPARNDGAVEGQRCPFDLSVKLRLASGDPQLIRQVRLMYSEGGRVSEFLFDALDKSYAGIRRRFLKAAFSALLKEIKFRIVGRDEFVVWYDSDLERDLTEKNAALLAEEDTSLRRFVDELRQRSRIIGEE